MSHPPPGLKPQHERAWRKFIGKRRLTHVERALTDPELISLRQELVKVDVRIADLEEQAKKGGTRLQWSQVQGKALAILGVADEPPASDPASLEDQRARLKRLAQELVDHARDRVGDEAVWDDVERLLELRRKLADTERKYEELTKVLIPATQVARLFDDLYASIAHVIPDHALRLALLYDIRMRLNHDPRNHPGQRVPIELPASYLIEAPADAAGTEEGEPFTLVEATEPDGDDVAVLAADGGGGAEPGGGAGAVPGPGGVAGPGEGEPA